MKLIKSDFYYLGIDLDKYPSEQLGILNNIKDLTVDKLVAILFDKDNMYISKTKSIYTSESIESYERYAEQYRFEIYNKINLSLYDIYRKLRYEDIFISCVGDNVEEGYKLILDAMVELREKGIKILPIEGEEIPDGCLDDYNDMDKVISILKERNIERLIKLFKEICEQAEKIEEQTWRELENYVHERLRISKDRDDKSRNAILVELLNYYSTKRI
jgi:hypothetical protein